MGSISENIDDNEDNASSHSEFLIPPPISDDDDFDEDKFNFELVENLFNNLGTFRTTFFVKFEEAKKLKIEVTPLVIAAARGKHQAVKNILAEEKQSWDERVAQHSMAFFIASQEGHLKIMQTLVESRDKEQISQLLKTRQGPFNQTPLLVASWKGRLPVVEYLLELGADLNEKDSTEQNVLHLAAAIGECDLIKDLLERDPSLRDKRDTHHRAPLLIASWFGRKSAIEALHESGVTMEALDENSCTVLHLSVAAGSLECVQYVLDQKPDLLDKRAKYKDTALIMAADFGYSNLVEFLLPKKPDCTIARSDEKTALHMAAQNGHLDIVKSLLRKDRTPLEMRDENKDTPLCLASYNGNFDIVEHLLEQGASPAARGEKGQTALHMAAEKNFPTIARALIDRQKSILNLQDDENRSALIIAVLFGNLQVVEILTQSKADHTIQDKNGGTALQVAAQHGNLEITQHLLDNCSVDIGKILELENFKNHTPIVTAVRARKGNIVDYLTGKGANIQHRSKDGRDMLTNAYLEENDVFHDDPNSMASMIESLLEKGVEITPDNDGRNVLHHACYEGTHEVIRAILKWPIDHLDISLTRQQVAAVTAAILATDKFGDTPLADAIAKEKILVILEFLNSKIWFPDSPCTEIPFLCPEEDVESLAGLLLKFLGPDCKFTTQDQEEFQKYREAVLYWAILNGQEDLISKLLKENTDPSQEKIRNTSLIHVAALGGQTKIVQSMLDCKIGSLAFQLDVGEGNVTILHLAVKHKYTGLVLTILERLTHMRSAVTQIKNDFPHPTKHHDPWLSAILQATENDETPLSLAAFGGTDAHRDIEDHLWKYLQGCIEDPQKFFSLPLTEEAQRILEVAAQVEPPREETYLRGVLKGLGTPAGCGDPPKDDNTLYLAVYHRCATVIWWLLSNGGYTSEVDIKKCLEISSSLNRTTDRDWLDNIVDDLLRDPPPVQKHRGRRDDHHEPRFATPISHRTEIEGSIVDLAVDDEQEITFSFKYRPISEIVYTDGPQKIMRVTKDRDIRSLKEKLTARNDRLGTVEASGSKTRSSSQQRSRMDPNVSGQISTKELRKEGTEKQRGDHEKEKYVQHGLRWIHIPVNNLRYIDDLMVRISLDKGAKNKEHRPLARFVRQSWAELPAGKMKAYMKPQCVYENKVSWKASGKEEDDAPKQWLHSGKRVALYMPYISWDRWLEATNRDLARTATREVGVHEAMTLDQYYYTSLKSTDKRDRDQALWRLFHREHRSRAEEKRTKAKADTERREKEKRYDDKSKRRRWLPRDWYESTRTVAEAKDLPEDSRTNDTAAAFKILTVDQLWLWVVDDQTIITSTTKKSEGVERSFFQRVLSALRAQERNAQLSIEYLMEMILITATESFNRKDIKIFDLEKSPLDVYRESILNAREIETALFDEFRCSLPQSDHGREKTPDEPGQELSDKAKREKARYLALVRNNPLRKRTTQEETIKYQSSRPGVQPRNEDEASMCLRDKFIESQAGASSEVSGNQFGDIAREADLLREVKDIIDELNMLRNLAEDQEDVWQQVWSAGRNAYASFTYDTPTEIKDDIGEMINEAKSVQRAIDTLLDLKQKQANIAEAQSTRKQSDTVMVFTVITILFLPGSFLASIFALNVSEYPHENGSVAFKGQWIFPIIIFVSLAISAIFSLIAFYWNTWKEMWGKWKKSRDRKKEKEHDTLREQSARSQVENV